MATDAYLNGHGLAEEKKSPMPQFQPGTLPAHEAGTALQTGVGALVVLSWQALEGIKATSLASPIQSD